jgi:hypothetical protein
MDIYHCGARLAVSGRAHDTGQNFLQSSIQTGSSSSPSYFQLFFLIAFLGEAFIRNITMQSTDITIRELRTSAYLKEMSKVKGVAYIKVNDFDLAS